MQAVMLRSYSRTIGQISAEQNTGSPGRSARIIAFTACSCAGFA